MQLLVAVTHLPPWGIAPKLAGQGVSERAEHFVVHHFIQAEMKSPTTTCK